MDVSIFDLFLVGVGPSSSHTLGPMIAAYQFAEKIYHQESLKENMRLKVHLYGSLALTGKGHATDKAILLGLSGLLPEFVVENDMNRIPRDVVSSNKINLFGKKAFAFDTENDLIYHYDKQLDYHTNGLTFELVDTSEKVL